MDALFAVVLVIYILSAVIQALAGKNARKKQKGAGEPWPQIDFPEEDSVPFPFEDVPGGEYEEEYGEEPFISDPEYVDSGLEPVDYYIDEKVRPWEDKAWGSLGTDIKEQSAEGLNNDEFYRLSWDGGLSEDTDSTGLMDEDIKVLITRPAIIQGIIMSEILKRPKRFLHYRSSR